MSFDDPTINLARPGPYVRRRIRRLSRQTTSLLNRRFENVGEFGYAYNPASTTTEQDPGFRVFGK